MSLCDFPLDFPGWLGNCPPAEPTSLTGLYQQQQFDLLPPGRGLVKLIDTCLGDMLEAFAAEYSRIHIRGNELFTEALPSQAFELLEEWETLFGLPDPDCIPPTTLAGRRAAILSQLAESLGQSEPDFQSIASDLGFEIATSGYNVSAAGGARAGQPLHGPAWPFGRLVVGESSGDTDTDTDLICRLRKHAHRHVHLNFTLWDIPVLDLDIRPRFHFASVASEISVSSGDIMSSWLNRIGGTTGFTGDIDDQGVPSTAPRKARFEAFTGLELWDGDSTSPTFYAASGLDVADTANETVNTLVDADTGWNLFIVAVVDEAPTLSDADPFNNHLLLWDDTNSNFAVAVRDDGAGTPECQVRYVDGSATARDMEGEIPIGEVFLIDFAVSGIGGALEINDYGVDIDTVVTSPLQTTGPDSLSVGNVSATQGFRGRILEIVSANAEGILGSDAEVEAVRNALGVKYGIDT